ncbi:MAG: RagB/SusD family nutrient uptake outer membrane protein [Bacteroidales bacterium]|jgi:hypothetical protein|nr:RagB/SusD family nutrient uptake outer membrane protein [Bacteroidales bacterium]
MKKIIFTITTVSMWLMVAATSCTEDVLDKAPLMEYTDVTVWSNVELMEAFLAEQYANTPVMIGDATCSYKTGNVPMNRDGRADADRDIMDGTYKIGNSAAVQGPLLTMDLTDETKYNGGARINLAGYKANGISISGGVLEWWENAYYTIRSLNDFIARAPGSPLSPELVQTRIAEARFLRAFCYFAMVKRYGGVPLLKEVPYPDSPDELLYPKRNSEKELWDFIIEETAQIADILPDISATDYGRANKWAALALNCRAALYAGSIAQYGTVQLDGLLGMSAGEAAGYYQAACNSAKRIMTEGPFALYNADADKVVNFKNIFLKKRNSETILAKQHGGIGAGYGGLTMWSWDIFEAPEPTRWGVGNIHSPYLEMVEEFEYADGRPGTLDRDAIQQGLWTMDELWAGREPRFYASVWTNGTPWVGADGGYACGSNFIDMHNGLIQPDGTILRGLQDTYQGVPTYGAQLTVLRNANIINPGFGIMKYLDPSADNRNSWFGASTTDYLIFRLAEILLNYAEAAFELGETGEALNAVNEIRDRAGIALLTSIDRDKIRHERKIELAFENHRYWDLRRWREAEDKLTGSFSGLQYVLDYNTKKFKIEVVEDVEGDRGSPHFYARNYYFPITIARTGANPNLSPENPGYD